MKPSILTRTIGLALAIAVFSGVAHGAEGGAAKASRDWQKYPAIVELDTTETVFAVGDPHGDPERLAGVLAAAMLTESAATAPDQVKWTAGKSVLLVTGDMIDKWTDSLGVIALLRALQKDAASQGGQVIITMGNHEAEFLADPLGKKTREFANELRAAKMDPREVGNCGGEIGQFLCNLPIGVRVNDWFFSHGGNSGGRTIDELNTAIANGFAKDGFATDELISDNSILEARLNKKGPGGMAWFMDGSKKTDPKDLLKHYASKLKVNHIVQGHQYGRVKFPDNKNREEETLFQRYGILFLIDSGMGRGIEDSTSTGGALRITGPAGQQQAMVICANGYLREMWDSKEQPDRKEQHCGK